MTRIEIMQKMSSIHNVLTNISVKGDDAILMSKAIIDLRSTVKSLQDDINEEQGTADE